MHLVIDYCALNKITQIYLAYAEGQKTFCPTKWCKVLFNLGSTLAGYHHIPLDESSIPKTAFTSPF